MSQRWKITIEYNGTPYAGWQRQQSDPSVQQAIEEAIYAFSGETVKIHAAGRTDAGVHALGQVAHFDLKKDYEAKNIRDAINYHLREHPVAILQADAVDDAFHARFGALKRYYCYRLTINRPAKLILENKRSWHIRHDLDIDAMQKGAQFLIGKHDFTTFRAVACQSNSPIKTIDDIKITENTDYLFPGRQIFIHINARSFMYHQVRNIAGTLKLVGSGKWQPQDVKKSLEAKNRCQGGPTAPAHGLYFMKVDY